MPETPHLLRLVGEWDIARRDELSGRMAAVLESVEAGESVGIDLTETAFIDSITLSVLIGMHRRLTRQRSELVTFCREGSFVLRTIRTAGLEQTLGVRVV